MYVVCPQPKFYSYQFPNLVEIVGCHLLRLSPAEEEDPRDAAWHPPRQSSDGGQRHLGWPSLGRATAATGHHVGFQDRPFQVDVVVPQGLNDIAFVS